MQSGNLDREIAKVGWVKTGEGEGGDTYLGNANGTRDKGEHKLLYHSNVITNSGLLLEAVQLTKIAFQEA